MFQEGYLGVVQLGESSASIRQQEIPAEDGHLIPKLHVLQRAIWKRPLLQIDNATVHKERCVDQLRDFRQVPLAMKQQQQQQKETFKYLCCF